jgi:peptidyl-tRNA hydrolase
MTSFTDVIVATRMFLSDALAGVNLLSIFRQYRLSEQDVRETRSPVEQNLYSALAIYSNVSSKTRPNRTDVEAAINGLKEEIALAMAADLPQPPESVITPAEWAAENPQSLRGRLRSVVDIVKGGDKDLIEEAVHNLRDALLEETEGQIASEPDLVESASTFVRAHKAHKMFGDSLDPAVTALWATLNPKVDDSQDAEPYLYILMRNDLASMNAGKAVAQGTHAANQMVFEARKKAGETVPNQLGDALEDLLDSWETAAYGFGTCIVLSVTESEMRDAVETADAAGLHTGVTHDPSYPLRDGASFHLIPLDTCAYVFAKKGEARPFVGKFPLMP